MKQALFFSILIFLSQNTFAQDFSFSTSCKSDQDLTTISFVGDILVHGDLYRNIANSSQDFSQLWKKAAPLIQKADFSVGNLEGPAALGIDGSGKDHGDIGFIYDEVVYSGSHFSFNYNPSIFASLKKDGFDLLTLANNHALDRLSIGADKTVLAAREANIPTVGTRLSQDRNGDFYTVANIKGLNIAFIGCTEMTNGIPDRKDQILFCYKHADKIVSLIQLLIKRNDIAGVVILPHWGVEYSQTPNNYQIKHAHMFLDAGAMAVVGSHPHVLQPWEKYKTQDGRETLVAYSLGNFLAFQAGLEKKTGAVLYLGLTTNQFGKAQLVGAAYTPTSRTSYEVLPVNLRSNSAAYALAQKIFGPEGFVDSSTPLTNYFCK